MATTRQRLSAAERREQLMAATVEILGERGFQAATADEIARRATVSKGLLWHYFTDLDDLFEATARRTLTTLTTAVAGRIDLNAPAPVVIRSAVRAAAALRVTHGRERRALDEIIRSLRTVDGQLRFSQADLAGLYAAQEGIFRRGQDAGHFRSTLEPRFLAVTYQGAVDAMLGYLDVFPDTDAERYADTVAEVLLGGISAPGADDLERPERLRS